MIEEVRAACADTHQPVPAATGEVMQCVYNCPDAGLPPRRGRPCESLTGKTYTSLNIVGGGSEDGYLNQQTANATGLTVFGGPHRGHSAGQPDGAVHPQRRFCRPGRGPRRHPAQL